MPQGRPAIPAEIERQVRIECGHCCAVCGCGDTLELAHIIPWAKARAHKTENLLLLCVSCHKRADTQKWGAKTLRKHKQKPWHINRHAAKRIATIVIPYVDLSRFDDRALVRAKKSLQAMFGVKPGTIEVIEREEGSVILTLLMDAADAERVLSQQFGSRLKLFFATQWTGLWTLIYTFGRREQRQRHKPDPYQAHCNHMSDYLPPRIKQYRIRQEWTNTEQSQAVYAQILMVLLLLVSITCSAIVLVGDLSMKAETMNNFSQFFDLIQKTFVQYLAQFNPILLSSLFSIGCVFLFFIYRIIFIRRNPLPKHTAKQQVWFGVRAESEINYSAKAQRKHKRRKKPNKRKRKR